MSDDVESLVDEIVDRACTFFNENPLISRLRLSRRATTKDIKHFFGSLGREKGYEVAASGFVHASGGEWLYDLVWYTQNGLYLSRQVLVLETEIMSEPLVDGDFQKLVQARSDVRVWLSPMPTLEMQLAHIEACKCQAREFSGSCPTDTYILITDNWTTPNLSVLCFSVGDP